MKSNKVYSLTTSFTLKKSDDNGKGVKIRGMASTKNIDRVGDIIEPEAWKVSGGLHNFKQNPIILFNHDYHRPIGKATDIVVTDEGLEIECYISRAAEGNICDLIEDGVLGAFSVGFRIKDADYIEETGGIRIKDAELFETSVVSVPCNQNSTFSLAKSFDSMAEYEEFRKTLNGQFSDEGNSSRTDNTPDGLENSQTENKMSQPNEVDLQATIDKAVEKATAALAMSMAEAKAAEKAEKEAEQAAAKAEQEQEEKIQNLVTAGIKSGTDQLVEDFQAKLAEKDANIAEVIANFKTELEAKTEELKALSESKRVFGDRNDGNKNPISAWGREFMKAHLLGVATGKGWDTNFARELQEKAGVAYSSSAPDIDQEVSNMIEKEVQLYLRTAELFREIPVNGAATVLPIQPDVESAVWQAGAATAGNLENRGDADSTFKPGQVILNAYRLISQTYLDNNVDEEVLINIMPMLVDSVARAHARAVDAAILNGNGSGITGLDTYATASATTLSIGGSDVLTAANLVGARKLMGKYGISPQDVAYVVSQSRYYELIEDTAFQDITDVGSDVATKLTGQIGAVYGSPVIVSDNFAAEAIGESVAYAVATRNYAIPRLRGVNVEQDYEVGNQRRVVVATQSLGFEELVADAAGNRSAVRINLAA